MALSWLERYMEYTKEFESPSSFHYWSAVWAIGSAVGRRIWTRVGTEIHFPSTYTILVSPSAISRKSTAMNKAIGILRKIGDVNFMLDKMTDAGLWKTMVDLDEKYGMAELVVHADELSMMFANDTWTKDVISSLTRIYGAGDLITKTLASLGTMEIHEPCINFLAGTTPTDLAIIFPGATTGMGFSGRCLFIFEKGPRFRNPEPHLLLQHEQPLVIELRKMRERKGEIPITPTAQAFYNDWYMKAPKLIADDADSSFLARAHIHILHLALILTLAKGNSEISRENMVEAEKQLRHIIGNLQNTICRVGVSGAIADTDRLIGMLEKLGGTATKSQLLKMRRLDRRQIEEAAQTLRERNMLSSEWRASSKRPALCYRLLKGEDSE